ncbi:MAG: Crp/Fnr family transcriptional regulator [Sphingobacteriales bacterium]|nr:Crp/Fnr family transcriptional regulator [Sphingobacteriales bacterium]
MDHSLILDNISKHISLNENELQFFVSLLENKKVKAKKDLLSEGEICKHSIFVTKGCLRGFTIDNEGFEHVLNFAPPGWWMADMYSLLSQKPGTLNIEALEDSEVILLSKENQERLYIEVPKFERFFRILIERSLVSYQQRVTDNMSLTAVGRYEKFIRTYPTLINTLPQKQIAAYIGVTPEFFSKMRTQMLKGK